MKTNNNILPYILFVVLIAIIFFGFQFLVSFLSKENKRENGHFSNGSIEQDRKFNQ